MIKSKRIRYLTNEGLIVLVLCVKLMQHVI